MEVIKTNMATFTCPECGLEMCYEPEKMSEEEKCMGGFFCPECGAFVEVGV